MVPGRGDGRRRRRLVADGASYARGELAVIWQGTGEGVIALAKKPAEKPKKPRKGKTPKKDKGKKE